MADNNESFLKILNDYFSNLNEHQIVAGTTEKITIPMEWIATSKIDRDIIEQAFINLFCKANKQYKENIKRDKQFYRKIDCLEIQRSESGVNLVIKARDSGTQTKVVVTSDKNLRGPFYAISEEQLYDEVLYSYNFKSAIEISKKLNLNDEERKKILKEELKRPEIEEVRKPFITAAMLDVAKNLTRYYDYMSKKKTKYETLRGTIQQRTDEGTKKRYRGEPTGDTTRKSEIYDFEDRENIFLEMNPTHIVAIDNIDENNVINKFAYTTYIYENPRGKDGYLFIAEPFEGNHNTRVRFVSREEYDKQQVEQQNDKLVHIAEEMTEMSNSECNNSKFMKMFKHTSIEKFREKYRRIVLGEEIENPAEKARYAQIDGILFDGKRKITKDGIEAKIEGVPFTNKESAKTALLARVEIEKPEQAKT